MKRVTPEKYVEGVSSIYVEQPSYQLGHDGSDGQCDCIGMVRGGLKRAGATDISGMNGTNYALRHTLLNVQKIKKADQLRVGDVVLKFRDKDDKSMPLPDQYRKGGNDYSSTWGEMNCTHIGTVTSVNPLRITHMTSPTAKIDTALGNWTYFGQVPWVDYGEQAEEQQPGTWVRVWAESGSTVKMRAKPSTLCRTYWDVPIGSEVILMTPGETWSEIIWAGRSGYMMSKFLRTGETLYTVTIKGKDKETAESIIAQFGGTMTAEG